MRFSLSLGREATNERSRFEPLQRDGAPVSNRLGASGRARPVPNRRSGSWRDSTSRPGSRFVPLNAPACGRFGTGRGVAMAACRGVRFASPDSCASLPVPNWQHVPGEGRGEGEGNDGHSPPQELTGGWYDTKSLCCVGSRPWLKICARPPRCSKWRHESRIHSPARCS